MIYYTILYYTILYVPRSAGHSNSAQLLLMLVMASANYNHCIATYC